MKHLYLLLPLLIFSGCVKKRVFSVSGNTPGIPSAVVIVRDYKDSTVFGENVTGGKFSITKPLKVDGYYSVDIVLPDRKDHFRTFEMYLEDYSYDIKTIAGRNDSYPIIKTSSKLQTELSAFYQILDSLNNRGRDTAERIFKQYNASMQKATQAERVNILKKIYMDNKAFFTKAKPVGNTTILALKEFVKRYPDNDAGIHLMDEFRFAQNPLDFYEMFRKLKPALQNSDSGKLIGNQLKHLVAFVPGAKAPSITGSTADGKPFAISMTNRRVTLIEFWKSDNPTARDNHHKLLAVLKHSKNREKVGLMSVSLDTDRDKWQQAVKSDQMNWLQIIDPAGPQSPNMDTWMLSEMPKYVLVDDDWNIIKSDLYAGNIDAELSYYLDSLP